MNIHVKVEQAVRKIFNTFQRTHNSTERKQHRSEKFWWLIAFGLSAWLCASSIWNIYQKWTERPVMLSIAEKETLISEIPFPSITICPESKAIKEKFDATTTLNKLTKSENLTRDELTHMEALAQICEFYLHDPVHFGEEFVNESIYETIRALAPLFQPMFRDCHWQLKRYNCSQLFQPIFTTEGLCYAFNALNSEDTYTEEMAPEMMIVENNPMISHWNMEGGYDNEVYEDEYPLRIFNARHRGGLNVYLKLFEQDIEYLCRRNQGYKVFLHLPGQHLEMAQWYYSLSTLNELKIYIEPTLTYTTEDLRSYSPNQRQCFFNSERRLRFFKMYTEYNCESECLANFTKNECGCVKFSMPRTKNTRICGAESVECYNAARKKIFGEDIINGLKDKHAKSFREQCNCLPSCTTVFYGAYIYRSKFDLEGTLKHYQNPPKIFSGVQLSQLFITFKEHKVVTLRRSALYTYTDFMAVCGGLLGLFLGVSGMSIIQLMFHSIIRLYWMFRYFKSMNMVTPFTRNFVISHISSETVESQRT